MNAHFDVDPDFAASMLQVVPTNRRRAGYIAHIPSSSRSAIRLPAPPVDPLDRDIRTLADHCMELDEIAAHFGLSEDDVTASLLRTTRVRRVI